MTQTPYPISPQPGAYPPAQVRRHELRPVRGLAIGAASVAIALTVTEVLEAALSWSAQADYLEAARNGESALDVWTMYDVMAMPWTVVGIAAYVLTCLWLFRARQNAEILRPNAAHARKSGWVWAGWLVPIVSLWFPFQIVRDVRDDPDSAKRGSDALIGWWWAFWLLCLFSTQIGSRLIGFDEIDPGTVQALGAVETINAALTVVALALWLKLMRGITQDQERAISVVR